MAPDKLPLHDAAWKGKACLVRYLLATGEDKNGCDPGGSTPLHLAAYQGHLEVVEALLEAGSRSDAKGYKGFTPLHDAVIKGHVDVVRVLLEEGANIEVQGDHGLTALHLSVWTGQVEATQVLVDAGADMGAQGNTKFTPLHLAAWIGHIELTSVLLLTDVDRDAQFNGSAMTALHIATIKNQADVAQVLVSASVDKDSCDAMGATPLHYAANNGFVDIVKLLLEEGANISIENNIGKKAMDVASITILLAFKRSIFLSDNIMTASTTLTPSPTSDYNMIPTLSSKSVSSSQGANSRENEGNEAIVHETLEETGGLPKNYCNKGLIGRGGYASVYLCTDVNSNQDFALKHVNVDFEVSQREIKAMQNEIDILRRLDHPNIVKYYGSDYLDGYLCITMEYIAKGSMRTYIINNGELSSELAKQCLFDILTGISYLHSKKIIHRDLKAANVLCTTDGHMKIADFGVSKQIATLQSGARSHVGTPYWMAPEVIHCVTYNDKVDIWGVGATAFEFISGKPPFFHMSPMQALFRIGRVKDMTKELKFSDEVDESLKDFILKCVQLSPEQRPSADDALKNKLFFRFETDRLGFRKLS